MKIKAHTIKFISYFVLLLALVVGTGIYSIRFLTTSSKVLEKYAVEIESSANNSDWDTAKANLTAIQKDWSGTQKAWTVLLDHTEIDNIEISLTRLEKYVEAQSRPMALAEAATLKQYIKHIPEKESFEIKNIL